MPSGASAVSRSASAGKSRTRRIGPDLIRRGGRQSNDWHVAHFYNPPDVNPRSVIVLHDHFRNSAGGYVGALEFPKLLAWAGADPVNRLLGDFQAHRDPDQARMRRILEQLNQTYSRAVPRLLELLAA